MSQEQKLQISIQEPTENQWSRPIAYTFVGLKFKGQIALVDLQDTSGRRINSNNYDINRIGILSAVQEADLSLATHPLYWAISEGRKNKTKDAFDSLVGSYYLTGSGAEYIGSKVILGVDPLVVNTEKGLVRFRHNVQRDRMNPQGNLQGIFLQRILNEYSAWFSKEGRRLNFPIYFYESSEDGQFLVAASFRSHGDVLADASRHPLNRKLIINLTT